MSRTLLAAPVLAAALGFLSGCDSGGGGAQSKTQQQLQTGAMKGASGTQDMMNQPTDMPGATDEDKAKMKMMPSGPTLGPPPAGGAAPKN